MSRSPLSSWSAASALLATMVLFLTMAGCNNSLDQSAEGAIARLEQELLASDRQFANDVAAASTTDRGKIWADWFSPEGRQIIPGKVISGTQSIAEVMSPVFATDGYLLTWEPDMVSASADRDMGWTSGRYENHRTGSGGTIVQTGRYLTIWRHQLDGTWKVDLDTGVPDPGQ